MATWTPQSSHSPTDRPSECSVNRSYHIVTYTVLIISERIVIKLYSFIKSILQLVVTFTIFEVKLRSLVAPWNPENTIVDMYNRIFVFQNI